jgi:hypothetical protein
VCPTLLGRVETRTFILIGPAILGTILSIATGNEGFIVIIGILLLEGVALDLAFYPFVIRWQPPWLTFVLAVGEFVILYTLSQILDVGLSPAQAVWFYWLSWAIAIVTKIVVLPIVSLSWIENGGEFRFTGWSVPAESEPMPILAADLPTIPGEVRLVREFSAVNELPSELQGVPAPSGVHRVPTPERA